MTAACQTAGFVLLAVHSFATDGSAEGDQDALQGVGVLLLRAVAVGWATSPLFPRAQMHAQGHMGPYRGEGEYVQNFCSSLFQRDKLRPNPHEMANKLCAMAKMYARETKECWNGCQTPAVATLVVRNLVTDAW